MKKILLRTSIIITFLLIISLLFLYYGIYSEGVRAGVVIKVSKKGMLFKTNEGQLNLNSFGALKKESNQLSETFDFSIQKGNDELYQKLEEVSLTGERINLHYLERYAVLPWRGETKYFVVKIDRANKPTKPKNDNYLK